jgi:sporulation protein YlmC with PRC-barrel domain
MNVAEFKDSNDCANATEAPPIFAMTDMVRYSATAKHASFPITEIFFDPDQAALRYLALDVGGWFDRREVIVSSRLMGQPDDATRTWPVEISPAAIEGAPEWSDPKSFADTPIASWPPIMIGPLGGHFGGLPPLSQNEVTRDPDAPGNMKVNGLTRLSEWVGLPVFGQSGEVGTMIDVLFDPRTGSLSHLVIDTGRFLAAQQMVVPYDLFRYVAKGGTHVVMDVTEKLLREAPPIEHFDKVNRSWVDTLRTYYKLIP